ncbi:MAG TPA: hypothetical protein VMT88_07740, partial [Actinomycetes bacterium]|nr:hypothetical protein [Actinomycetes bacterium]
MADAPRKEPHSSSGADSPVSQASTQSEAIGDVIEGGSSRASPGRTPPRKLVIALEAFCVAAALVWLGVFVFDDNTETVAAPSLLAHVQSFRPDPGELTVNLTNNSPVPVVIESVAVTHEGSLDENPPPAPAWLHATVVTSLKSGIEKPSYERTWPEIPSGGIAVAG